MSALPGTLPHHLRAGEGTLTPAKSQIQVPSPPSPIVPRTRQFQIATGSLLMARKNSASYELLPTEIWLYILTFLPYHTLKKLTLVSTFFLDLQDSQALDENLFRSPRSTKLVGDSEGPHDLHPVLLELGHYIGWSFRGKQLTDIPIMSAHRKAKYVPGRHGRRPEVEVPLFQAPTTIFVSSFLRQRQHPVYKLAERRRSRPKLLFLSSIAHESATQPPAQRVSVQVVPMPHPLVTISHSEDMGDYVTVLDVVEALAKFEEGAFGHLVRIFDKVLGDKYVGLAIDREKHTPDGSPLLVTTFDVDEDTERVVAGGVPPLARSCPVQ